MGMPIATVKSGGICFAFPDVCTTPPGVPVPYPNIGQMSDAKPSAAATVKAGGYEVIHKDSQIPTPLTTGDEAGTAGGGVTSGTIKGAVTFATASSSVKVEGHFVVRMFDTTRQNSGNAVGQVLGGEPTVLVGG